MRVLDVWRSAWYTKVSTLRNVYTFGRKVEFYERGHQKKATRKLVISPMVNEYAQRVAKKLGIEVYSYAEAVEAL